MHQYSNTITLTCTTICYLQITNRKVIIIIQNSFFSLWKSCKNHSSNVKYLKFQAKKIKIKRIIIQILKLIEHKLFSSLAYYFYYEKNKYIPGFPTFIYNKI